MPKTIKLCLMGLSKIGKIGNIGRLGNTGLVHGIPIEITIKVVEEDGTTPVLGAMVKVGGKRYVTTSNGEVSVIGYVGKYTTLEVTKAGYPNIVRKKWMYANVRIVMGKDSDNIILENGWDLLWEDGGLMLMEEVERWIWQHMVFWYDMKKPMDIYVPDITYANPFVNNGGKISYTKPINRCIVTHTPTNNGNVAFWQKTLSESGHINAYKIKVTGLPNNFIIKGRMGYELMEIISDGTYDVPSVDNINTTAIYPGFYFSGVNVDDVDCNITIEQVPTEKSVPTNDLLSQNPYLQDFSGNNRPLKLNNFLFGQNSGIENYKVDFLSWTIQNDNPYLERTNSKIICTKRVNARLFYSIKQNIPSFKVKITISNALKSPFFYNFINENGANETFYLNTEGVAEFVLPQSTPVVDSNTTGFICQDTTTDSTITIEQMLDYPNALITDGVDDYGVVQNLDHGVKMLMMNLNPFTDETFHYSQATGWTNPFSIFSVTDQTAYNAWNPDGVTYIDGVLNTKIVAKDLVLKDHIVTIVNDTVTSQNSRTPTFFTYQPMSRYSRLAFYNAIGFDDVPSGDVREQDVIDFIIKNFI